MNTYIRRDLERVRIVDGKRRAGSRPRYAQETVLIVSANRQEREPLGETFADAGYHVLATADPGSGLELCRHYESAIHLLIAQLDMEGGFGLQMAEAARRLRPGLAVLFLSPDAPSAETIVTTADPGIAPGMMLTVAQNLAYRTQQNRRRN